MGRTRERERGETRSVQDPYGARRFPGRNGRDDEDCQRNVLASPEAPRWWGDQWGPLFSSLCGCSGEGGMSVGPRRRLFTSRNL